MGNKGGVGFVVWCFVYLFGYEIEFVFDRSYNQLSKKVSFKWIEVGVEAKYSRGDSCGGSSFPLSSGRVS